jgi:hypothetical protein
MRARLSEGGVKSFLAHVAGVAAGVVAGLAAAVVFAAVAPTAFAYAAAGALAVGAAVAGAKLGDTYYHWARGEEADANVRTHMRAHFGRMPAASTEGVALA